MTDALAHRGPDGEGHWVEREVALGHRRLAVIDLSSSGRQPMASHDGRYMLTYNGELYNFRHLRVELERLGHRFQSTSDTEVLLAALVEWGAGALDRFEGMFAFALWDRRDHTLMLARDRTGIKPLYYANVGDTVAFGSELKAILAAGIIRPTVAPAAFHSYLASGYVAPGTSIVEGVSQVLPGSLLVVRRDGISTHRYWRPVRRADVRDMEQAKASLVDRLTEVAEKITTSDVPIGLTLSGGIDSAIIALLFRNRRFSAFTAQFENPTFDETLIAKRVAKIAGHDWVAVDATSPSVLEDFKAVAIAGDGELADSSALAHYTLCRGLRSRVTVALAGDGADEFFGGYPTISASRLAAFLAPVMHNGASASIASLLFQLSAGDERRIPRASVAARFLSGIATRLRGHHVEWRRLAPDVNLRTLFGHAMAEERNIDPLRAYCEKYDAAVGSVLDKALIADQLYYLPGDMLTKVDRMSMSHGLEIRVPFLERPIVELAADLHGSLLTSLFGPTKRILRAVASELGLPSDVARLPKQGFNVPVASLLRSQLRPFAEAYLMRDADIFLPYLRPDSIRRLWKRHAERRADHGYLLWALLVHALWREHYAVA